MERRQDVSVVRLPDVLLGCRNDVSKGLNNDIPSARLHDVSNETHNYVFLVHYQDVSVVRIHHDVPLVRLNEVSQIKHPIALLWYVSTTFQSYVFAKSF